ncbi:MAG TPA: SprT family zinc-dependent metalloprotease [Pseudonocardia sp.]|nr:SprT family zinc-dependent metalloprotease [Pseudonocardia sp.]
MGDRLSTELLIDGHVVVVQIRKSRRARTMRLTVGPGRPPEVVVPSRVRQRAVDEFISAKQRWLGDKLAELRAAADRPRELFLDRPGTIWLAGAPVQVSHDPAGRAVAALRAGRLAVGGTAEAASAAIERWYRREARRVLLAVAELEAGRLGVRFDAVGVRDPRTRWGSCSHNGRLSFSWRLLMAPEYVLDYVVVHELCHLREFNHSRSFWQLVETARPEWREARDWLRRHGHELHEYRPASAVEPGAAR